MQQRTKAGRRVRAIAVAACALAALATSASAQSGWRKERHHRQRAMASVKIGAFGGATFATGMTRNGIDPGWNAGVVLDVTTPRLPVGFRLSGAHYHLLPSTATANGAVKLWGGDLNLLFTPRGQFPLKPYLTGGIGLYRVTNNITSVTNIAPGPDTKFSWNGGIGIRGGIGSLGVFLEGRYLQIFTTGHDVRLIPVTFGFMAGTF
jgi:opacity protein-like surface antigen